MPGDRSVRFDHRRQRLRTRGSADDPLDHDGRESVRGDEWERAPAPTSSTAVTATSRTRALSVSDSPR